MSSNTKRTVYVDGATAVRGQQQPQNPLADLAKSTSAPSQPGNSDPSRNSVLDPNWDIADFVQKYNAAKRNGSDPGLQDFSSYIRSIKPLLNCDVLANEHLYGRPLDLSKNANEQLNSPSNSQANHSSNSGAGERFNPQPGSSKNLSEDLSSDETDLGPLDFSKSNSEVAKEVTKN